MTMSWSDAVYESTHKPTRPSRPTYVPPHLRLGGLTVTVPDNDSSRRFITESPSPMFRFDRTSTRQPGRTIPSRGRGRGRGRNQWHGNQKEMYNTTPEPNPFDIVEKFDELEVIEDVNGDVGINFNAYEDIPVEASGENIPPPVNTFADIDLGEGLNENIKRCKFVKPTPIQRHAIPIAVAGRDLMACAQTGSGKTAAFCFPIICGILRGHLSHTKSVSMHRGAPVAYPLALILSPTRELSCQIHEEAKKFAYKTGIKVVVVYGGAPISHQFHNMERGVDILVATPGRLVDMIERGRVSLRKIKYLALDEADRMLDMGFEPQIRKIVEQMDMPAPGTRQTMLLSATFPDEIQRLASDFLSNYIFLSVGRVGSSTDLIAQRVELVEDMDKRNHLIDLLHAQQANGTHGKLALTLVFVETKRGADALENWLARNGFPATAIHGDKVQMERERALRSFKSGATPIMVATDVAARGLDIPHVSHVINFDLPKAIDDYVHRIGRTGRAGKSGLATAFFNDANLPIAKALVELMQEAKQDVPSWLSECAERSSYTGGRPRYRGGRFGGHDYRSAQSYAAASSDHYHSGPYVDPGPIADSYVAASSAYPYAAPYGIDSYAAAPYGGDSHGVASSDSYAPESYASIVADGWD